jgi:hypothetical protein
MAASSFEQTSSPLWIPIFFSVSLSFFYRVRRQRLAVLKDLIEHFIDIRFALSVLVLTRKEYCRLA